ncbi:MAG: SDR family oxidoreductase [Gammaproteobacteria bacterium]|nr:SDR family oxidoreductase [Gammaproteobacteria bacterium]
MMDLGVENKVALITGASDGLGRAAAERLAAEGAKVAICARRREQLERTAGSIADRTGAEVLARVADVTRAAEVDEFVGDVVERFGGVDILLNNAGTSAAAPFEAVDDALWQADFDLKLMAAVRMCRRVIPLMRERGGGAIVNITTVGGKAPEPKRLPTSVTRAAGINLTKALAGEYAADNIRVNTICIGKVKSAQWERRVKNGDVEALYAEQGARIPLGRMGETEEFADLLAFLVSERAAYITGTAINFDGGLSFVV